MRPEDLDDNLPPRADGDMLATVRNRGRRLRQRRMAMRSALGAVLAAGLVSGAFALGARASSGPTIAVQPTTTSTDTSSTSPTSSPVVSPTTGSSAVATTTSTTRVVPPESYPYMYPFTSLAAAQEWQSSGAGQQPWHLDPGLTAKSFADFLGYSEADQVISTETDASGAHVALGYDNPNGQPVVAARVHLVRAGDGNDAPWEVVGNEQLPSFTLTTPTYNGGRSSAVRVAGTITGVDENIRVSVHQQSSSTALGEFCCLPAGGQDAPWETAVSFANATDSVVVISASTGGHIQQIERFVFTAIRPAN